MNPDETPRDMSREPSAIDLAVWPADRIAGWLDGWLTGHTPAPYLAIGTYDDVADGVVRLMGNTMTPDLQSRLGQAVQLLVEQRWSRKCVKGLDYLMELLLLVGRLDLPLQSTMLAKYLLTGYLKGKRSRWGDLHLLCLKALLPYHRYDPLLEPVLKGDIREPLYAAVCFKGLCAIDPRNAALYMPLVMESAAKYPKEVLAAPILFDLGQTLRSPGLVTAIDEAKESMSIAARCVLLDALELNPFVALGAPYVPDDMDPEIVISVHEDTPNDPFVEMRDERAGRESIDGTLLLTLSTIHLYDQQMARAVEELVPAIE